MIRAAVVGGAGYVGGELVRLLLDHPEVELAAVTSETHAGRYVHALHPNLRGRTTLRFRRREDLEPVDVLFLALPHGEAQRHIETFLTLAPRVVALGADFRLRSPTVYRRIYGTPPRRPDLLGEAVYGLVELHREDLPGARLVSGAGCIAAATLLALAPLYLPGGPAPAEVYVDAKVGSSAAGVRPTAASHHPERAGAFRSFAPVGHRHTAEITQELGRHGAAPAVHLAATAVPAVRGILVTCQVRFSPPLRETELRALYREAYGREPFVRLVTARRGLYRYPEPKILAGSNYCDVGLAVDEETGRAVLLAALDNLMKGAAGNAVQAVNVLLGFPETAGLTFPGLHPV